MRFYAVSGSAARQRTDCAIVGLYESGTLSGCRAQLDAALGGRIARLVKRRDARGKLGECTLLDVERGPCERVLLVGLGKKDGFGRKQYKKALLAAAAAVAKTGARDAVSYLVGRAGGGHRRLLPRPPGRRVGRQRAVPRPGDPQHAQAGGAGAARASASPCRTRTSSRRRSAASSTVAASPPAPR